jgi:mutator protein MutT
MKIVTAAILINNGKIFIAKRKSLAEGPETWEFPNGKMGLGETPEQCLQRAMQEEFRMSIHIGDLFGESSYEYGQGSIKLMAFRVNWDGGDIISSTHDDFKWVDIADLRSFYFAPADTPFVDRLIKEESGQ